MIVLLLTKLVIGVGVFASMLGVMELVPPSSSMVQQALRLGLPGLIFIIWLADLLRFQYYERRRMEQTNHSGQLKTISDGHAKELTAMVERNREVIKDNKDAAERLNETQQEQNRLLGRTLERLRITDE